MDNTKTSENGSTSTEKKPKKCKTNDVLSYLQTHESISQAVAIDKFHAYRLSDIIFRLKKRGYNIQTRMVTKKNVGYDSHCTYAEYSLVE